MTGRGKFILTLLILAVLGFAMWNWWDKIAPPPQSQNPSIDPAAVKRQIDEQKVKPPLTGGPGVIPTPNAAPFDPNKLLAGEKSVSLIDGSSIPPVAGVSDYDKTLKDGKIVVQFPINVWPGWAPI